MSQANELERQMLELINQERTSRGLDPLQLELRLNDAAEDYSQEMLDLNFFSHTGLDGSNPGDRMRDAGFEFEGNWRWGENLAWQSERGAPGLSDDVVDLHNALMNSPGHRANILRAEFTLVGIGIETGNYNTGNNSYYSVMITQKFARTDAVVQIDAVQTNQVPELNMIVGTLSGEILQLTIEGTIKGMGGDDLLIGTAGGDMFEGGDGNDSVWASDGDDTIVGGDGNDELWSSSGDDNATGNAGDDTIGGANGDDTLSGGNGDDNVWGGGDDDQLFGANGRDTLAGGNGEDEIWSGNDDDVVYASRGDDTVDGGSGNDDIWLGTGNDSGRGGAGNDIIRGWTGSDTLDGGAGNDTLIGGADADTFIMSAGQDRIQDFRQDVFGFDTISFANMAEIENSIDLRDNHMQQIGSDVVIDDGLGNTLVLENVNIDALNTSLFDF